MCTHARTHAHTKGDIIRNLIQLVWGCTYVHMYIRMYYNSSIFDHLMLFTTIAYIYQTQRPGLYDTMLNYFNSS